MAVLVFSDLVKGIPATTTIPAVLVALIEEVEDLRARVTELERGSA